MLKKSICITIAAILVVFAVVAAIYFIGTSNRAGTLKIYYSNGLAGMAEAEVTQNVALYKNDQTEEKETRANTTKLLTLKKAGFQRAGYTFNGWTLGFGGDLIESDYVPKGLTKDQGIITFVADWTANEYFVTFNPDYPGLTAPEKLLVQYDQPVYGIALRDLSNQDGGDLEFHGWRTQKNGKGTLVTEGSVCKFTEDTMLYAWWVNKVEMPVDIYRNVTIQSKLTNGSTGPFATEVQTHLQGHSVEFWLKDHGNGYNEYNGYTFSHFQIGGQTYSNFGNVFTFVVTGNTTVTVYYTQVKYFNVTFQSKLANGAVGPFDTETASYMQGSLSFWLVDDGWGWDEYDGYTFNYFSIGGQTYQNFGNILTITLNSNITVIAHYTYTGGSNPNPNPDPNPNPGQSYTVSMTSQLTSGGIGPFDPESSRYNAGTLSFWLVDGGYGWNEYTGYTFSHFVINGTTYQNFGNILTINLTSNTNVVAYYTLNGGSGGGGGGSTQPQTFTLTIQSYDDLYSDVGPFNPTNETWTVGSTIEFWLVDGGYGFNEYTGGYVFSYFQIGSTKYYPNSSGSGWTFTGNVFSITLSSNTTIVAHYI